MYQPSITNDEANSNRLLFSSNVPFTAQMSNADENVFCLLSIQTAKQTKAKNGIRFAAQQKTILKIPYVSAKVPTTNKNHVAISKIGETFICKNKGFAKQLVTKL